MSTEIHWVRVDLVGDKIEADALDRAKAKRVYLVKAASGFSLDLALTASCGSISIPADQAAYSAARSRCRAQKRIASWRCIEDAEAEVVVLYDTPTLDQFVSATGETNITAILGDLVRAADKLKGALAAGDLAAEVAANSSEIRTALTRIRAGLASYNQRLIELENLIWAQTPAADGDGGGH